MSSDHDGPFCASLGHYVAGITVAYCPHLQSWTAVVRAGDESDDTTWRMETIRFGPFDSDSDVAGRLRSELQRLLRADRAGWVAQRTAPG